MKSADDDNDSNADLGGTQSFFLDGLTFAPGAEKNLNVALPEPTEEFNFLRVLGVGGMGVVFEAEELRTHRRIALKVIAPQLRLSSDAAARFEREAKASASLSHPHCVFVYGAYRVGESPAIAMELMTGDTLDDRIKAGDPIAIKQALVWTRQMLEGLQAAHESGLIHRDIKPSNVFISEDGAVKIGDFGLTRSTDSDLSLTQSGAFLGSPLYASPEQIRGHVLDARSDIYSIGATLYALLAGVAPHTSTNIGDLFARIATEAPKPLRELRPEVPKDLELVIEKALAKQPGARFTDCVAFQEALSVFGEEKNKAPRLLHRYAAYLVDSLFFIVPMAIFDFIWNRYVLEKSNIMIGESRESLIFAEIFQAAYFVFFEGLTGASLGKRLMGLRVIDNQGDRPGIPRACLRFMVYEFNFSFWWFGLGPGRWGLGWALLLLTTMRKKSGMRGLHEWASGTRVVEIKDPFFITPDRQPLLDPDRVRDAGELLQDSLDHYVLRSTLADTDQGALWLGRDERLGRDVWIVGEDPKQEKQDLIEPTVSSIHFLDRIETENGTFLIFEAPGGASLHEYRNSEFVLPWKAARQVLIGLIDLILAQQDMISANRLWIGRAGKLRLLPFALRQQENPKTKRSLTQEVCCSVLGLESLKSSLPEDIPKGGKTVIRALLLPSLETGDLAELREELVATDSRPRSVPRAIRGAQIVLSSWGPLTLTATWLILSTERLESIWEVDVGHRYVVAALFATGFSIITAMATALIFRGGLGFSLFGIRVIDGRAHRCSRRRCALRAVVSWLPLPLLFLLARGVLFFTNETWANAAAWGILALFIMAGFYSIWKPTRSFADHIVGTHLVR